MNVLLTGGTGFIGSHVAIALLESGHEVTILARNPNKVPALAGKPGIDLVQGDLTDLALLESLVQGKDACIHVALNYTGTTGHQMLRGDTLPSVYLADCAAEANVKHFIYTSSTSVNDCLYQPRHDHPEEAIKTVTALTKQRPCTFYGATKAASENYLIAASYQSQMRANIIRPGYVFGNPVVPGASTQGDTRFRDIVRNALNGEPIHVGSGDGTQFIWAGDLAKLYVAILHGDVNRKTYLGLSKNFVSWREIAEEAIAKTRSGSEVVVEGRSSGSEEEEQGVRWDVSDMKKDFGLEFDPWPHLRDHLDYVIACERRTG